MKNNSKYYYVSNQNMSQVKESIDQYSQHFQKQSNAQSKYHQSISEDIQYSRTNKLASQSIADKNMSKKSIKPPLPPPLNASNNALAMKKTVTQQSIHSESVKDDYDRPIDLGFSIWDTIQERYYQTNKISTEDPDVLYDFYLLQRKTVKPRNNKIIEEQYAKLQKLMPSMKRKMQIKLDFQKMLLYKTQDVAYSLQVAAHSKILERELKKNQNILNAQLKKTEKKKSKPIKEVVNRLYGDPKPSTFSKTTFNTQELQRVKLLQFGRKLSQAYQTAMRDFPDRKIQSLSNLYHYWNELYDKEQYGLEWNEETAQRDIKRYMIEQVNILKIRYQKKVGYSEGNGVKLYKFLVENPGIQDVCIPPHSFEEYVKVFNLYHSQQQQEKERIRKAAGQKQKDNRTKSEIKKFGRPVSATPLTILAKPKQKTNYGELYTKYGNDKLINTLMVEQRLKVPRYPFQYGVYDIVDQLKVKNRVVPKPKVNYDMAITKLLTKTINNFSGFFSPDRDRVLQMLEGDDLGKDNNWKQDGQILQEAMLVKSYEEPWFRGSIISYMKNKDETCALDNDKVLFAKLFKRLNEMNQDDREDHLNILRKIIQTSRQLAKRQQGLNNLQKKDQKFFNNEKKLMYVDLLERAKLFVKKDFEVRTGRTDQKLNKRQFLNQTYSLLTKNHKEAMKKFFNAVQVNNNIEDKQCPKLLKYQFYRLCKEVNPENYERDERPRAPNWVPTRQSPDSFNYKSHNQWSKAYKKDKNRQPMDPQPQERSNSLWGQKNVKDRELLMMTYADAKECYFHPKVKKLT